VLSIAGKTRKDMDAAGFSRAEFPTIFYKNKCGYVAHAGVMVTTVLESSKTAGRALQIGL
jgi:hypothetical protein